MIVAAIDPGYGSGYATYDVTTGEFASWETHNGVLDMQPFNIMELVAAVCESFLITEKTGQYTQQTDALKHIGFIEQYCMNHPLFPDLVMQQPSAKKFGKQNNWNMLKRLGWYTKTKDDHAADAAAHLLTYLLKNKLLRADDMNKLRKVLR